MRIVVLGAGVQGTLYGVRLARCGHDVTFVARKERATELRARGAVITEALTGVSDVIQAPVIESLSKDTVADLCIVTVRREQLDDALKNLAVAGKIARCLVMVNHAHGSEALHAVLGRERVILGFPGAAGGIRDGVDCYVEIAEQRTVVDAGAPDIAAHLRNAGFRVELIRDMDAWLQRHAVFVTAIAGALYKVEGDANRLALDAELVRTFIFAVREGWTALDRRNVARPPLALRAIFLWVPLRFSSAYWSRLLQSPRGELYFALHTRHAPQEMAALATDVRTLIGDDAAPNLRALFGAIDDAASASAH